MAYPEKPSGNTESSQNANAGKNLIQVGRDYLKYLQINISAGNWIIVIANLIVISLTAYGLYNGSRSIITHLTSESNYANTSTLVDDSSQDSVSSSTITPQSTPEVPQNPFNAVTFPQDACGDTLPENPNEYPVSLYRVFIDFSEENLNKITSDFCRDAFKKRRDKSQKDEIQVASFLSLSRANSFKDFMIEKLGSGDVSEPSTIAYESQKNNSSSSNSKVPSSKTLNVTSISRSLSSSTEFEAEVDCLKKPSGYANDLEFTGCDYYNNYNVKNYTNSWFEVESASGDIELVRPGRSSSARSGINLYQQPTSKVKVLRHQNLPIVREVTIRCDQQVPKIWVLEIIPKCTSEGIYIDISSADFILSGFPAIDLVMPSGEVFTLETGSRNWITYGDKTITFKLQLN